MTEIINLMNEFQAPWCRVSDGANWQIFQAVRGPDGKIVQLKKTYTIRKETNEKKSPW